MATSSNQTNPAVFNSGLQVGTGLFAVRDSTGESPFSAVKIAVCRRHSLARIDGPDAVRQLHEFIRLQILQSYSGSGSQ